MHMLDTNAGYIPSLWCKSAQRLHTHMLGGSPEDELEAVETELIQVGHLPFSRLQVLRRCLSSCFAMRLRQQCCMLREHMYPMQVEASIESLLARQQQLQGQREQLCRTITLNSRALKADWQGNFAWDAEVDHLLHSAFALASFRSSFYSRYIWQPVQCTASLHWQQDFLSSSCRSADRL